MARKVQEVISDVIMGYADGSTVPFALAAGLSSTHNTALVVIGGISEVTAGMVSMGAGGWQSAQAEDQIEGSNGKSHKIDAVKSGITVGMSYGVGGIVPLLPYMLCDNASRALLYSIVVTTILLFSFGVVKGRFTKQNKFKSGLQTLIVGGISAAVAYLAAHYIA